MVELDAWRVHDTGLVAAPGRFRRLGGQVRHHRPDGDPWPARVRLVVDGGELRVAGVGAWPVADVAARLVALGPPASFVLEGAGGAQLLAAAPGPALDALLAALG